MKCYGIALFLLLAGLASAANIHDDGQPGCKEPIELEIVHFRNHWDPTRYWSCIQKNVAAVASKCPEARAWLDSQKQCVEWHEWVWEEPSHPPSKP